MQKLNIQQLPVEEDVSLKNLWSSAFIEENIDKRIQNILDDIPLSEEYILNKLQSNPDVKMNGFFFNTDVNSYCYFSGLFSSKSISGNEIYSGFCCIYGIHESDYNCEYNIDSDRSSNWIKSILHDVNLDDSIITTSSLWSGNKIENELAKLDSLKTIVTANILNLSNQFNNKLILDHSARRYVEFNSEGMTFTAPSRGIIYFTESDVYSNRYYREVAINGTTVGVCAAGDYIYNVNTMNLNAGDVVSISGFLNSNYKIKLTFVPYKN